MDSKVNTSQQVPLWKEACPWQNLSVLSGLYWQRAEPVGLGKWLFPLREHCWNTVTNFGHPNTRQILILWCKSSGGIPKWWGGKSMWHERRNWESWVMFSLKKRRLRPDFVAVFSAFNGKIHSKAGLEGAWEQDEGQWTQIGTWGNSN